MTELAQTAKAICERRVWLLCGGSERGSARGAVEVCVEVFESADLIRNRVDADPNQDDQKSDRREPRMGQRRVANPAEFMAIIKMPVAGEPQHDGCRSKGQEDGRSLNQ